jgi:tRNA (5-methylaminomethyl-2-thiouridylate)-methyltransferase
MNIAALVSGGVDSSVVVHLLKEMGYDPTVFYIKIGLENEPGYVCPKEEDIEITEYIARKYACKMKIVDLQKEYYDTVIKYTIDTVSKGYTPNPDIMCNLLIKFGAFNDKYGQQFDRIATGHYAGIEMHENAKYLCTSVDKNKDQTYFLGRISGAQLQKAMFPLQNFPKTKVREIAHQMNLPSALRPDSQGICFLGKINYNDFIRQYVGEKPGGIIELETGKRLGEHKGIWFHTIGQRKGLGLSQGPWFVVKKDIANNLLFVSNGYDPSSQYGLEVKLGDFKFINEKVNKDFSIPKAIKFKIRHSPEFLSGTAVLIEDEMTIKSDQPIAGIAPGQFGVVYDFEENLCLGAGIIEE